MHHDIRSGLVCRGSYALGSACGKCERCATERVRLGITMMPAAVREKYLAERDKLQKQETNPTPTNKKENHHG